MCKNEINYALSAALTSLIQHQAILALFYLYSFSSLPMIGMQWCAPPGPVTTHHDWLRATNS